MPTEGVLMADETVGGEPIPRQCSGTNADGSPCRAPATLVLGSGYCYTHNPENAQEWRAAQSRGGLRTRMKQRKGLDPADLGPLETPEDAMRWTKRLALAVATGELPSPQARTALVAIQAWLKAYEIEQADREIAAIEAAKERR